MNSNVEAALNEQIHAEFFSFYLYLSVAAYFKTQHLDGFAHAVTVLPVVERTHIAERIGTPRLV